MEFLKHEPDNYRAQLELADLRERGGIKQSTIEPLLKDAVKANPDEPAPRLALIGYYTRQRKAEAALQAAQEAVAALPADLDLLAAFGAAQMAAGNPRQAVATFAKMAAQSATPEAYLQLARVHAGMKDYAAADGALRKALDIAPQSLAVQRDMIELALARKRTADALAVARDVERQRPRESTGYLMEAGIQAEQKAWPQAIAAAREAFARERSTSVAMRLHALYLAGGQPAEAEALAARWLQEHRDDAMFLFHLGSMALDRKDYAAAEARYREVLALRPGNAVTLNNVAYTLLQQAKPGALPLAEQATKLMPGEPAFMDTMSRALAAENRPSEALDWARKAVDKAPDRPEYRLQLARLLIAGGQREKARAELDRLAALGGRFGEQAEVTRLRAGL